MLRDELAKRGQEGSTSRAWVEDAETDLRRALSLAADAFLWIRDARLDLPDSTLLDLGAGSAVTMGGLFETSHTELHVAGDIVGGLFGCVLEFDDGWFDTCPTSLAHVPLGNSIGFVATYACTVCQQDASECSHLLGRIYDVVARRLDDGTCSVCAATRCDHEVDALYPARAGRVVRTAEILEVSLVNRPRDPLARITAREVDPADLERFLGRAPSADERVLDHTCMGSCEGLRGIYAEPNPRG